MQYPRGLIRYSTQNALDHKPARILRPRVLLYAALLSVLVAAFGTALFLRKPVELDVIRDRNALYRLLDDGRVENVYDVKVLNKSEHEQRFRIEVTGAGALSIDPDPAVFAVRGGEVYPAAIRVRRPAYEPPGLREHSFRSPCARRSSTARELYRALHCAHPVRALIESHYEVDQHEVDQRGDCWSPWRCRYWPLSPACMWRPSPFCTVMRRCRMTITGRE